MTAFKQPKFGTAAATNFAALLQRFLKPLCSAAAALPISYGLLTWPLNGSEAGVDLVLIQTSLLLLCKSSCSYAN